MPARSPSEERVLKACAFEQPDRIPRFDEFWGELPKSWREQLGPAADSSDVEIWVPHEAAFPTRARHLKEEGGYVYEVDEWGRTLRRREGAYFAQTLEVPLPPGVDPDSVQFDPPDMENRFLKGSRAETLEALSKARARYCVFAKTGGPFLRTSWVRGEEQFLADIAQDPALARALADKVCDHLTAIGIEALRRWSLQDTGIWIFDDMAYNEGPMFHPRAFERILLPAYRRMISRYKEAGARYVFLHSDGDIRLLLDMLIDAGIDGINPVERRANMDVVALRKRYPKLVLAAEMDNSGTMIQGPVERIRAEAREIIGVGRHGGVIICGSLSPDMPPAHFLAYHETCVSESDFSGQQRS